MSDVKEEEEEEAEEGENLKEQWKKLGQRRQVMKEKKNHQAVKQKTGL